MTKKELIGRIHADINDGNSKPLTKKEIEKVIDTFIDAICNLPLNDPLTMKGFGRFELKTKPAHTSRNPRTGEPIQVPETTKLNFKAAKIGI